MSPLPSVNAPAPALSANKAFRGAPYPRDGLHHSIWNTEMEAPLGASILFSKWRSQVPGKQGLEQRHTAKLGQRTGLRPFPEGVSLPLCPVVGTAANPWLKPPARAWHIVGAQLISVVFLFPIMSSSLAVTPWLCVLWARRLPVCAYFA